ncbi:MAG: pyridoxal phosphate-dependent aminotransferase [Chitinophagales bacterium]
MQVLEKTMVLSDRIINMAESATLKMAALARQLTQQGKDVINLSIGEPDFGTPEHIKEAAIQAIKEGYSHYTPVPGYLDLREAIVHKLKRDNNLDFTPNQIIVSTGAKQSLANVILSIVNPGEEVIMPIPYWVSYAAQVELAEGVLVEVPTYIENQFKITPDDLEKAITSKTKLFVFSSPCNPTGSIYTKDELQALAEVFARHEQVYIISDEIYEHITFEGSHESIAQFDFIKDRVIVVNGLSKGFAMTGWRLGYIAAPLEIAQACDKMQGQFTSGTCGITQRAAIAALTGTLEPTYAMRDQFKIRRKLVLDALQEILGVKTYTPSGAFYVFPDVSYYLGKSEGKTNIETVDDLCMYLLDDCQVSVVTGAAFGNDQCIRISYAASNEQLIEAMQRIKGSLAKLA